MKVGEARSMQNAPPPNPAEFSEKVQFLKVVVFTVVKLRPLMNAPPPVRVTPSKASVFGPSARPAVMLKPSTMLVVMSPELVRTV